MTNFPTLQTTSAGPEWAKLKIGLRWLGFVPETYPHCLRCRSYRFSSVRLKIVSIEFWRLLRHRTPLEQSSHCLGYSFYNFLSVRMKNVSVEFWRLFPARLPPKTVKLKIGPEWLGFALKTYPPCLGCNSYISCLYGWKIFWSNFDDFFERKMFSAGKVKNRDQMTWFCTRNIPTRFRVQFLSFPISTVEQCFSWILTTFPGRTPS